MATELELTQVSQLLTWLETERKKDKAMLATLEERLQGLLTESQQQAKRLQELDSTLAATRTVVSKMTQIDRILDEYKIELNALLDRRDDDRKKSEREAARLRAVEVEELNRAVAEIKKELSRVNRVEEEMGTRRAEEKRLSDQAKQTTLQVDLATKQLEERTRGIPYLEEGRRQDNKRIAQLEADGIEHSKRIESLTAKQHLLEDALSKFPTKVDTVNERVSTQDKTIEEIRVMEFRRQQQMKSWEEELARFRAQMTDYGDMMSRLREQAQVNQKATADLAAFQETLRQRAAEIAEVERLFETRVKRTLEEDRAEDEKRWQKHLTRIDERWHDHDRLNAEQLNRIDKLETARDTTFDAIDELRKKLDDLIHRLVDFGTGLAETRKSTLPNVSVPPATSPEDGRGIPEHRPRKRS
jgi:chromosome segregation ATPase